MMPRFTFLGSTVLLKTVIAKTKAAGGGGSKHKMNSTMVWLNGDKAIAEMSVTMLSPRQQKSDGNEFDQKYLTFESSVN